MADISNQRHCAVTGTSGYVGAVLASYLEHAGWHVHRLGRGPSGAGWSPFDLRTGLRPGFFRGHGIRALVHCAWDFRAYDWSQIYRTNVLGSIALLTAARSEGVDTGVFISSVSAFEGCKSLYGKGKLAVENEALRLGYSVIRPGLIYGRTPGGVVGALLRLTERSMVIPLIAANAALYMTHEDDLCALVRELLRPGAPRLATPIIAAPLQRLQFQAILRLLGDRSGRTLRFVPVPWQVAWAILRLAELCRLRVPFRSDSVVSLINQNPAPDFLATCEVGITFRELQWS